MGVVETKTTPINCIECAFNFINVFDGTMGGKDPVVDHIVSMAKTSISALMAAAMQSEEVSKAERGRLVEVDLDGCEAL